MALTLSCCACGREMAVIRRGPARIWRCGSCNAHALTDSTLRKMLPEQAWPSVWPAIRNAADRGEHGCPGCGGSMDQTQPLDGIGGVRVDFCDICRIVWLDPSEFDSLPKRPPPEPEAELPPAAAQAMAKAEVELMQRAFQAREEESRALIRECLGLVVSALLGGL